MHANSALVYQLSGPPAKYLVARNRVIVGGVPTEGHRAIRIGGARQLAWTPRRICGPSSGYFGSRCAGQRLLIVSVVGESDLDLDGIARVGSYEGVGGARLPLDVGVRRPIVRNPLVAERGVLQAVLVGNARNVCFQRSPTWAVPPMIGAPVAGLLGRAATVAVAALVTISSLSASSVKVTLTLMELPT